MKKLLFKKADEKSVKYILENLREYDREECILLSNDKEFSEIVEEQTQLIVNSDSTVCYEPDSEIPVCVFGVAVSEKDEGIGCVFMLSTDKISEYKKFVYLTIPKQVKNFDKKYYFLYNIIYDKNTAIKKLLKKAGFKFDMPKFINVNGFEAFYRVAETKTKGLGICV